MFVHARVRSPISLSRSLSLFLSLSLCPSLSLSLSLSLPLYIFLFISLSLDQRSTVCYVRTTGESCSTADNCRFEFDLCVDGVCKVNPSVQEDASVKTTVSVNANAYDTHFSGNNGCGDTGCLPGLTRDSSTIPESRWSCSKKLGEGNCYLEFEFDSPQDVISMNIAFYKGDERTRKIEVCVDQACCWAEGALTDRQRFVELF